MPIFIVPTVGCKVKSVQDQHVGIKAVFIGTYGLKVGQCLDPCFLVSTVAKAFNFRYVVLRLEHLPLPFIEERPRLPYFVL